MDLYAVLNEVEGLLQRRGRASYRLLRAHFGLSTEQLDALRAELFYTHPGEVGEDTHGLVWHAGPVAAQESPVSTSIVHAHAERRQLTMLFCDLVGSTPMASQFDAEEWREIMGAFYDTCAKVIARYDGHIALYLGDGLLVYFGYPLAHEDDPQRAVRAGLGMIRAIGQLNSQLTERHGVSLAVRVGCHTGPVVVGGVGDGTHGDELALGETPNVAARLQEVAPPNTLVIGALTHRLLGGLFACSSMGTPPLKGVATPLEVFQVLDENSARTRLEALGAASLTPLVGRQREMQALQDSWADGVRGGGRVVLLRGEAGIGKSRLVRTLAKNADSEDGWWLTPCQCSPYYQHTALYPFIDLMERVVLRGDRQASAEEKTHRLEEFLLQNGFALETAVPLFTGLLSIPLGDEYAPLDVSPAEQKQQTLRALLTILHRRAARQPVLFVVEDLHWVDPTTLELLTLVIDEIGDTRILALFTCRPDFSPPWKGNPAVTTLDIDRLSRDEVAELARLVAGDKTLPEEVLAQVVAKTDGVPLFVEELTKMLLESGLLDEHAYRYELTGQLPTLAVPDTLHDSLMARLDRLGAVKWLAQLAATLGREFSYALLKSVSQWDHARICESLDRLVAAEFLYQDGNPPSSSYRFRHALIQDAAYQSLLKSTRQSHHQRIAHTLEAEFPEIVTAQPELIAHHYTEAGLTEQAIPYWLAAGQRALQRHANHEAANHAERGLDLLSTLPEGPARARQELALQLVRAPALVFVSGPHSVEHVYNRARELARQVGSTPELFPVLSGLAYAQIARGHMKEARELAEEFLELAGPQDDSLLFAVGHWLLAYPAWWQGDFIEVRDHSRRCLTFYRRDQHRTCIAAYGQDPGTVAGYLDALADWVLGYPSEAVRAMKRTVAHARSIGHPFAVSLALLFSAQLSQLRREPRPAQDLADEALALSAEHSLDALELWCLLPRGWAVAQQGDVPAGLADIREAMERRRTMGMGAVWPWYLALAAEAYGALHRHDEGLAALDEAVQWVDGNDEHLYEAEVYRIRGELLLAQDASQTAEAEQCFQRALAIARDQQAKSWELRAATSLGRLWRATGRGDDARELLLPVYTWFTEGHDTADLQDAKALLNDLR